MPSRHLVICAGGFPLSGPGGSTTRPCAVLGQRPGTGGLFSSGPQLLPRGSPPLAGEVSLCEWCLTWRKLADVLYTQATRLPRV